MARSADVIVDVSPLDAPTVNVPLRIGWLLRTSRLNPRTLPALPANRFATELGVGPAAITKWEKGSEDVDAVNIEGYERLIGLPAGSLRGLIEITRRSFRYPPNPRLAPPAPPGGLEELSDLVWPAMHGRPAGIDWLHFADALNADGPLFLPAFTAAPVIDRLASELARSVDAAYLTRYEAMARLRTGRYRDVALHSLLDFALADDAQVCIDLLDVAGELPSAELFETMCELLVDPSPAVFKGACHSIGNMAALGGISKTEMRDLVPLLVRAYNAVSDDPRRHRDMSELLRNLPRGVQDTARQRLGRAPAPAPTQDAGASRDGPAYRAMVSLSADIRRELPTRENPMLERLLFEAMFDPMWNKRYIASLFLIAVPYKEIVSHHVARLAEAHPSRGVRDAAVAFSMRLGSSSALAGAEAWARSGDPLRQVPGLVTLGHWATDIDRDLLELALRADGEVGRRSLYAAGMSGNPVLRQWADDAARPAWLRAGARWWLRVGSRVTV
ncbi:MAG: hypothetical protein ACR2FG_09625 [Marmoricola sp.]